jgi:hypothetical protein
MAVYWNLLTSPILEKSFFNTYYLKSSDGGYSGERDAVIKVTAAKMAI